MTINSWMPEEMIFDDVDKYQSEPNTPNDTETVENDEDTPDWLNDDMEDAA